MSEEYGQDSKERPIITLANAGSVFEKFIQLLIGDQHYFRTILKGENYHAEVLERTLNEFEIKDFKRFEEQDGWPIPAAVDDRYRYIVIGMGDASRYSDDNLIEIAGGCIEYSLKPDKQGLIQVAEYLHLNLAFDLRGERIKGAFSILEQLRAKGKKKVRKIT